MRHVHARDVILVAVPFRWLWVWALLATSGCKPGAEWYAPPMDRKPLQPTGAGTLGSFIAMNDAAADAYVVSGVSRHVEGGVWRWAGKRAEVRFRLGSAEGLKLRIDFTVPEVSFKQTGPVSLSIFVNGVPFDRVTCDRPGERKFEKEAPPSILKADSVNTVAIETDKVWTSPVDGAQLGFILTSVGFGR